MTNEAHPSEQELCDSSDGEENLNTFGAAYGIYVLPNGETYQGDLINGKKHGHGVYIFNSGAIYDGSWIENAKHGYGIYHYTDGSKYAGNWFHDKRHGFGTYFYCNGDIYQGNWYNHLRHGDGVYKYSNGVIYEGVWEVDKRLKEFSEISKTRHSMENACESDEFLSESRTTKHSSAEKIRHENLVEQSKQRLEKKRREITEKARKLQERLQQLRAKNENRLKSLNKELRPNRPDTEIREDQIKEASALYGSHDKNTHQDFDKEPKLLNSNKINELIRYNYKKKSNLKTLLKDDANSLDCVAMICRNGKLAKEFELPHRKSQPTISKTTESSVPHLAGETPRNESDSKSSMSGESSPLNSRTFSSFSNPPCEPSGAVERVFSHHKIDHGKLPPTISKA